MRKGVYWIHVAKYRKHLEGCYDPSGFNDCVEFIDKLRNCWLLKEGFAAWSYFSSSWSFPFLLLLLIVFLYAVSCILFFFSCSHTTESIFVRFLFNVLIHSGPHSTNGINLAPCDMFVRERPRCIPDRILRYTPSPQGWRLALYPIHNQYLSYRTEFLAGPCHAHLDVLPPPLLPPMPHHVAPSLHRSRLVNLHTHTSFDDALSVARSQERLIGKTSMGVKGDSALGESPKSSPMGEWTLLILA